MRHDRVDAEAGVELAGTDAVDGDRARVGAEIRGTRHHALASDISSTVLLPAVSFVRLIAYAIVAAVLAVSSGFKFWGSGQKFCSHLGSSS